MGRVLRNVSTATSIPISNPGVFVNFIEEIPRVLVENFGHNGILDLVKIRAYDVIASMNERQTLNEELLC